MQLLANAPGFPMEVGRMMGGRFSKVIFNGPVFVAFNIPIWCAFAMLFETYPLNLQENYMQMSVTFFMTLATTAMFGAFGIVVEACVLHFRKHWPTPAFDDFEIYIPPKDGEAGSKWSLVDSDYTSFNIVYGRPTGDQVMAAAHQSEAPGIFMCGPVHLLDMVRKETNKENTWLGRTRFCMYDEPFDL